VKRREANVRGAFANCGGEERGRRPENLVGHGSQDRARTRRGCPIELADEARRTGALRHPDLPARYPESARSDHPATAERPQVCRYDRHARRFESREARSVCVRSCVRNVSRPLRGASARAGGPGLRGLRPARRAQPLVECQRPLNGDISRFHQPSSNPAPASHPTSGSLTAAIGD
jgi:hypothetical protein